MKLSGNIVPMLCQHGTPLALDKDCVVLLYSVHVGNVSWMGVPLVLTADQELVGDAFESPVVQVLLFGRASSLRQFADVDLIEGVLILGLVGLCFGHVLSNASIRLRSFLVVKSSVPRWLPDLKVISV